MIEIKFKNENGYEVEGTSLVITAEMIMKSESLKETFWEIWNEEYNDCTCSLNESQSYCECDGQYGVCYISSAKDIKEF